MNILYKEKLKWLPSLKINKVVLKNINKQHTLKTTKLQTDKEEKILTKQTVKSLKCHQTKIG